MEWRIVSPEEEATRGPIPPEIKAEQERRAAWDKKHPRCSECGQFLRRNPSGWGPKWISHFYQSSYEYNEWDHI